VCVCVCECVWVGGWVGVCVCVGGRVFLWIKVYRVRVSTGTDTMIPVLAPLTCGYQKIPVSAGSGYSFLIFISSPLQVLSAIPAGMDIFAIPRLDTYFSFTYYVRIMFQLLDLFIYFAVCLSLHLNNYFNSKNN